MLSSNLCLILLFDTKFVGLPKFHRAESEKNSILACIVKGKFLDRWRQKATIAALFAIHSGCSRGSYEYTSKSLKAAGIAVRDESLKLIDKK